MKTKQNEYYEEYNRIAKDDLINTIDKHKHKLSHKPLLRFMGNIRHNTVLDMGCGNGELLNKVHSLYKFGCDIAEPYINKAYDEGLMVFKHDIEKPFKQNKDTTVVKFDIIYLSSVLEHVLHPKKVIANIKLISHDKTRIFILVPYKECLEAYTSKNCKYKYAHLRSFDEQSLQKLFKRFRAVRKKVTVPKNMFIGKLGWRNVLLRKLMSFCIVYLPNWGIDLMFIKLLNAEGSTIMMEFELQTNNN